MSRSGILIIGEVRGGKLTGATLESISEAGRLVAAVGGEVSVGLLGEGVAAFAATAGTYGASTVYVVDDAELAVFRSGPYTDAAMACIGAADPQVVLLPNSADGREMATRCAARLGVGVVNDVTVLQPGDARLRATHPCFGGSVLAEKECLSDPQIFTVRPNSFARAEAGGEAAVVPLDGRLHAQRRARPGRGRGQRAGRHLEPGRSGGDRLGRPGCGQPGELRGARGAWPPFWARRSAPAAPWWTPAGSLPPTRWGRRARRSRPRSTSPAASRGPSSTRPGCRPRRHRRDQQGPGGAYLQLRHLRSCRGSARDPASAHGGDPPAQGRDVGGGRGAMLKRLGRIFGRRRGHNGTGAPGTAVADGQWDTATTVAVPWRSSASWDVFDLRVYPRRGSARFQFYVEAGSLISVRAENVVPEPRLRVRVFGRETGQEVLAQASSDDRGVVELFVVGRVGGMHSVEVGLDPPKSEHPQSYRLSIDAPSGTRPADDARGRRAEFVDVPVGHPYREAVVAMAGAEVMGGYGEWWEFAPDEPVTRVQLAEMVRDSLGSDGSGAVPVLLADLAAQERSKGVFRVLPRDRDRTCHPGGRHCSSPGRLVDRRGSGALSSRRTGAATSRLRVHGPEWPL